MHNRIKNLFCAYLLISALPALAQDSALPAGKVISSQGQAEIVWSNGQRIQVTRRAEVREGETLETGPNGYLQIRLTDDALISLSCNSALKIVRYRTTEESSIELHLARGRLRSIIGTVHSENYLLRTNSVDVTQVSSQTDLELVEESTTSFSSGVYTGRAELKNSSGSLILGLQGDFDFSLIANGDAPIGIPEATSKMQSDFSCI